MKKVYYLAYDANVSSKHMLAGHSCAKVVGTGILKDWRLMFKGTEFFFKTYATIEKWKGYEVPFVLWELGEGDEERLDHYYEKIVCGYQKKNIEVELDGKKYNALLYVKDENLPVDVACHHYTAVLWEGYEEFGFDLEILKAAEEFSETRRQICDLG